MILVVKDLQERERLAVRRVRALRNVPVRRCKCYKDIKIEDTEPKLGLLIYKPNHNYTTNNVQSTSKEKHACNCTNKVHQELKYRHQNA